MHKCLLDGFSTDLIWKHPRRCSKNPDNLLYALIIEKSKRLYCWNFLSALFEWRYRKLIRRYFQWHSFVATKCILFILRIRHALITFVLRTLRTQVIRLNSVKLGPQKTDSGVLLLLYIVQPFCCCFFCQNRIRSQLKCNAMAKDTKQWKPPPLWSTTLLITRPSVDSTVVSQV